MRTLSARLFVISTWTVIKLSAATFVNAATLPRFGVSRSAPNGCLSRAMTWSIRICLSVDDSDEGGRRDAASPGNVVDRSPNDRPRGSTSHDASADTGRARDQWRFPNRRRPVVCVLFGYHLCYASDGLSVEETVDPRMNEVQRAKSKEIFLTRDLHNLKQGCLCTGGMSRPAPRSR